MLVPAPATQKELRTDLPSEWNQLRPLLCPCREQARRTLCPEWGGGCQASPAQGRHALFWGGHLVPDTGPGKASQSREEKKKGRPHHQVDVGRGLGAGHGRETPGPRGRLSVRRTSRAARGPGLRARATPRACKATAAMSQWGHREATAGPLSLLGPALLRRPQDRAGVRGPRPGGRRPSRPHRLASPCLGFPYCAGDDCCEHCIDLRHGLREGGSRSGCRGPPAPAGPRAARRRLHIQGLREASVRLS